MEDARECDPFGTLISIVSMREHEIGKLRRKITELTNRLTKVNAEIEEGKRKEMELIDVATANIKKESELRSRISSLNASINLAEKLRNDHINRLDKERFALDEIKNKHNAILTEKRELWAKYEKVYESLDGAKELRKEKGALKLLQFKLLQKKMELKVLKEENNRIVEIQDKIESTLSLKIRDMRAESTAKKVQNDELANQNRLKSKGIDNMKNKIEILRSKQMPFNVMPRANNTSTIATEGPVEDINEEQPVAKKMCLENIGRHQEWLKNRTGSQITNSSQAVADLKEILTGFKNMTNFQPRRRMEQLDPATKKLMLQLEESKKAIENRSKGSTQHLNDARSSPDKFHDRNQLKMSRENVSLMGQNMEIENRSDNYTQNNCQKEDPERLVELMPPPAFVPQHVNDTTCFTQTQSDYGYHTQSTVDFQDEYRQSGSYYNTQNTQNPSQAFVGDYMRLGKAPSRNLNAEVNCNASQSLHYRAEKMDESQPEQYSVRSYNPTEISTVKYLKEKDIEPQKNENDVNTSEFKQPNATLPLKEQEVFENKYVESEYFSTKKGKMEGNKLGPFENIISYDPTGMESMGSPGFSYMQSPICSPIGEGLMSPPPPSPDSNVLGSGFQMSNKENAAAFAFGTKKSSNKSKSTTIFNMLF